jgi:prephenate dehydrogenase
VEATDWPTIAVMGAGAVGCYFGGMLARAGAAVTFIGRRQDRNRSSGLRHQPQRTASPSYAAGKNLCDFSRGNETQVEALSGVP